jgi:acetyltransferase-like isoleucine patch superfamily enzyme
MALRFKLGYYFSKKASLGRNAYVHSSVQILGAENVTIGDFSCISEYTWFNVNHRRKNTVAIRIGDNCFIGRRNFFSSGKRIEIGSYVLTTIDCKFICSAHVTNDPLIPYLASGTTSDHAIRVGANCVFGAASTILGNIDIGHGSVIGAHTLVVKSVPPFSMVVGNPGRILRRYSFSKRAWIDIDKLLEEDLRSNPDEVAYLDLLRKNYPRIPMPLIAAGSDWNL